MPNSIQAGVSRADITPPVGIAHTNWGAQTHVRAAGTDLDLLATAVAITGPTQSVVLVDLDVILLREADAVAIQDRVSELTGVPTENVRISYTHTHSGPTTRRTSWAEEGEDMVSSYLDALPDRIAGIAWEALNNQQQVSLAIGTGSSTIAVNRRFKRPEDDRVIVGHNQDGPVDHDVSVLRFNRADGSPLATIVHYACHPITVGPDNELITPDYPGVVKRVVENNTESTCLFLQGAAGNVGPIYGTAPKNRSSRDEYRPLGRRLGHEATRLFWELDSYGREESYVETLESGAPLAVYEYTDEEQQLPLQTGIKELDLPLRDLGSVSELEAKYEECQDELAELREAGGNESRVQELTMKSKRLYKDIQMEKRIGTQSHMRLEAQVFGFGGKVALVAIPGEPFIQIGQRIKQNSRFDFTVFSGYSNESVYSPIYIPVADAYQDGGYEVETSPFTPEAASVVVEEVSDALDNMYSRNTSQ